MTADGRAVVAENLFNGAESGGQLVGRVGGAAAAAFDRVREVSTPPLRSSPFSAVVHPLRKVRVFGLPCMMLTVC